MYDTIVVEMAREPRSVVDNGGEYGGAFLLPFYLVVNGQLFQEPKRLFWVILDSAERKEAVVSVTRENNSLVCSAQNEGIVRKHREPSITLCTLSKVFSFTQKGKDRKGFAVLLKSCSPHYTTSPAVVGPLSSNSLTVAGAVGKVQALMVSESVYGSSFLSSPPLGGLPHP